MADIRETLLLEVHRAIEAVAKEAVSKLGRPVAQTSSSAPDSPLAGSVRAIRASLITYPPTDSAKPNMSPAELNALARMSLSAEARSGLEKLFADAAAGAFFRFFCLLDGVGDPEVRSVDNWVGAEITVPSHDGDRPMLHDDFFESFRRYREQVQPPP